MLDDRPRNRGQIPGMDKGFVSYQKRPDLLSGPPGLLFNAHRKYFRGVGGGGESNQSLPPSFGVKNERSYSSSPPYAIKACTGTPLS